MDIIKKMENMMHRILLSNLLFSICFFHDLAPVKATSDLENELLKSYEEMEHPHLAQRKDKIKEHISPTSAKKLEWEDVQKMFAFPDFDQDLSQNIVPMNAANFCPPFKAVSEMTYEFQKDLDHNIHMQHRINLFKNIVELARKNISKSLNVDKTEIAFVRNTSEANNIVNNGYQFRNARGRVLVWNENHGTNGKFIWRHRLGNEDYIDSIILEENNLQSEDTIIKAFLDGINEDTEVVTFTEISNVSGIRIPAKGLCKAIHEGLKDPENNKEYKARPDIHIHIDGAQSWGSLSLDLKEMDCDSFAASAHKWLCGPREVGLLYVKNQATHRFKTPNIVAYDGQIVFHTDIPRNASRFELLGQRNDASLLAIGLTHDLHSRINENIDPEGKHAIQDRVANLADLLITKLSESKKIKLITPSKKELRHGIVVAEIGRAHV